MCVCERVLVWVFNPRVSERFLLALMFLDVPVYVRMCACVRVCARARVCVYVY